MKRVTAREAFLTKKGSVAVRFPYDPAVVESIKAIHGRKWAPDHKLWYFQHYDAKELMRFFDYFHFALSPDLQTHLEQRIAQQDGRTVFHSEDSEGLVEIPKVRYAPWGHQKRAYAYIKNAHAVLLDMGMGTGKSRVVIDYVVNNPIWLTLIICPKAVIPVWTYQEQEHAAEPLMVWTLEKESVAQQADIVRSIPGSLDIGAPYSKLVVVTNYESAWRSPLGAELRKIPWDLVVLDESHRIKAPGGKASRFMAVLRDSAARRLCLTGTPMPHSPTDIYGQYRFLDPGIFGTSFKTFRDRYCIMGGFNNHQIIGYQNQEEFTEKLNAIRFHASRDVLDLPEVVSSTIPVNMSGKARTMYTRLEKEFYTAVGEGKVTIQNALVKILRLQQVTSGHIKDDDEMTHDIHTGKIDALTALLIDIPADEPVVVFCRFLWDLDAIHKAAHAASRQSMELSGRRKELTAWTAKQSDVLAVQINAGAEGIDLTKAHYCVYFSFTHSLGQWEQAHARVHRPGQDRTVFHFYLTCQGTIDTKILSALQEKKDVVDAILGQPLIVHDTHQGASYATQH